jgi:hypothetical protein
MTNFSGGRKMAELQLVQKYEPECDFVIDDILEEDKEILQCFVFSNCYSEAECNNI